MKYIGYWEKESTKQELIDSLNKEKLVLSGRITDYLKSLLELEFSVLKKEITDEERNILAEYTIYKRIAAYNIYNRALNILKKSPIELDITGYGLDNVHSRGLEALLPKDYGYYNVFSYMCSKRDSSESVLKYFDISSNVLERIGDISLFQLEENLKMIQKQRENIFYKSEENKNNKNYYMGLLKDFDRRIENGLASWEKEAMEVVNMLHAMLLEDYGLKESDFNKGPIANAKKKTLIYKSPKLIITNNKRYI